MLVRARRSKDAQQSRSRPPGATWRGRCALALTLMLLPATLTGCVSRTLEAKPAAHVVAVGSREPVGVSRECSSAVLETLASVAERVYHEGVLSERTGSARYLITSSRALREAVETGDRQAAGAAARALLRTGHLTNVMLTQGRRTLVSVGGPAIAPLRGTLTSLRGAPLAGYETSVWADSSFLTELGGITHGLVALRSGDRNVGGSPWLPQRALAASGSLTRAGASYRYTSFTVAAYPSGTVRVYLSMPTTTIASLCGRTREDTTVNTLERVAELIYDSETGEIAERQLRRVEHDEPLLQAVAHASPQAARRAIDALLNEHVVRVRVSTRTGVLADVGGPYVLGPVSAPLRLRGQTLGSVTLSIQDDEGYARLMRRLAGLYVLVYADPQHPRLVKDSVAEGRFAPALSALPASGPFTHEGRSYRILTVHAVAFPSGPLVIRVLVPSPYLGSGPQAGASDSRLLRSAESN